MFPFSIKPVFRQLQYQFSLHVVINELITVDYRLVEHPSECCGRDRCSIIHLDHMLTTVRVLQNGFKCPDFLG